MIADPKSASPALRSLTQIRDELFAQRLKESPATTTMSFWEGHPATRSALETRELQGRILDFGCGTGEIDIMLGRAGRTVVGFDPSPAGLDIAREHLASESEEVRGRVSFVHGEVTQLPFPDQSFDSVWCRFMLEQIPHLTPTLKELARVLRPGGALVTLVRPGVARYEMNRAHFFERDSLEEILGHFFTDLDVEHDPEQSQLKAVCRNRVATRHPRIVAMMRIRNEERWIKQVLDSIARVCDGIVIVDDGSTDHTPEICKFHPAVLDYFWQNEPVKDQVRDKTRHLKMALAHRSDWILSVDGDEVLEQSAAPRIFEAIRTCPHDVSTMKLEFLYMWNDLEHIRADGIYRRICHERLFKLAGQDIESLSFRPTHYVGNGHCKSVPGNLKGRAIEIDVKVEHLGYMYPDVRQTRYERYRRRDPEEFARGDYEHLLDQPHQIIEEWHERPYRKPSAARATPKFSEKVSSSTATVKQEFKPDYYYANARRNLVELVPQTAHRVLDVGCGHGMTGGLLRVERGIEVVGIEIHEATADVARQHLTQVIVGDIESMDLPFEEGYFDCLLLGDVLEHLANPWLALKKLTSYLSPDGTIVASLPNIRNLGVISKLLKGSWAYEEWGILDKTHLRFFALKDMKDLFAQAGIEAKIAEIVRDPLFENEMKSPPAVAADVDLGGLLLKAVRPEDLNELTAQQFIFTGTKIHTDVQVPPAREMKRPEVSVVIPAFNNLEYTRQCVTSLFEIKEPVEFEVIVVDNGSTDGTAEYLQQLPPAVRTVSLSENLGFAKGCNAGARAARGKYLVFLNNDTVAQRGWLASMLNCAESDAQIGLVGNLQILPDSGKVQHAGIVCGENKILRSLYNNELSADHPAVNKAREFQFVAGSCLLIEKDFFEELGGFDENYLNSCEDVDLCMKVRAAGRKVYYCPQSRIVHFESKTVSGHEKKSRNYELFLERWADKIERDDLHYLREDGFLPDDTTPPPYTRKTVVLIAPPRYFKEPKLSDYTGFSKNLGLGYVAAMLKQDGVNVSVVDAFAAGINHFTPVELPNGCVFRCGLTYDGIAARIPSYVDYIGINIPFTNVAGIGFELAESLKSRFPKAKIVLGGVHPSTFPEDSLRHGVDFVVAGEGELAMAALVRGDDPATIDGLYYRDETGDVHRPQKHACVPDLNALPFPAWDLLPMDTYLAISPRGDKQHRALSIITSRGCPFGCRFCSVHPVSGRNWRARSVENVLAEVREAMETYGINHLEIEDDNFTLNRERALAILRGLHAMAPRLTWSAHNGVRVDTLDKELLEAIKESGCVQLNLAVEHGSPSVLKAMNKKLSLNKVTEVVETCGKLSISTVGFCLIGYPGETKAAFRESFEFFRELKKLGLTTISPFIVNAYPGTELYAEAKERGWLNPATDSQLFFLEDEFVSVTTPDFDENTVRLRKRAMEILNEHPNVNADHLLNQIPHPAVVTKQEKSAMLKETRVPESVSTAGLKVAILTTYNQHCGLATYAEFLVGSLRENGCAPLILAEKTDKLRGPDEADTIRCWTRDARGGDEIIPVLQEHNIQLLHVNHGGMFDLEGWLAPLLTVVRQLGIRVVTTFHTTDSIAPHIGQVARLADRVLVHHPQNRLELVALGAPADRIEHVPHGMPTVHTEDIFESKLALGWNPEQQVVSTFGFVEAHKGILQVIDAMKPVHDHTGAHLHVLGGPHPANPDSAKYLESCKQKVVDLGLTNAVMFSNGFLGDDEVARRLRASDVIVMNHQSQRYESSGATMIALASGRPVVSSSSPAFDLPSALTFKVTESFDLGQAIYTVLLNPFVRRQLLNNVLDYEQTTRWNVIGSRVAKIYRDVAREAQQSDVDLMHYYRGHPDSIYAEPLQRERVQWLKSKAEGRILEIGPANGYLSAYVGGTAAVDISRGRLAVASVLRPNVRFEYGNVVEGLPYGDREFDQVHAPEILEHVDFEQAVLALKECLRVGRRVLATLPNADKPDYDPVLVHNVEHRWLVNRQAVDRLLRKAGAVSYELDASQNLDFYLLDILADTTRPNARIHERAAFLTSINVDPGEPIHVGVDCSALEDASGHARAIDRYMVDHFTALMKIRPHWQFTLFGVAPVSQNEPTTRLARMASGGYAGWTEFEKRVPDVLYLPYPMGPIAGELLKSELPARTLIACTMHDVVPLIYADAYLKPNPTLQESYISQLRRLRERCDLFFCGSQVTLQELQVHVQLSQAKLRIIHGAASELFGTEPPAGLSQSVLARLGLDNCPFLLTAGAPDHCRNATGMFLALASAQQSLNEELLLVIAGELSEPMQKALHRLEQQCGLTPESVVYTGPVSDGELNILYHQAVALLHPSLYEGYDGALLDAMAARLPVIAGNNSAQTELVGEAALLVDPRKTDEIASGIVRLHRESHLRLELVEKGMKLTRHFTWKKAAEKTAIYLSEAVALRARKDHGIVAEKRTALSVT